VITAAVTAAIVGLLALFGVKPSPWAVGAVAVGVKIVIVAGTLAIGARLMRRKKGTLAAATDEVAPSPSRPPGPPSSDA